MGGGGRVLWGEGMEGQKKRKPNSKTLYKKTPPAAEFSAGNPTGVGEAARVSAGNSLKKSLDLGVWGRGGLCTEGRRGSRVVPHQDQGGSRKAATLLTPLGQLGLGRRGQAQAARRGMDNPWRALPHVLGRALLTLGQLPVHGHGLSRK